MPLRVGLNRVPVRPRLPYLIVTRACSVVCSSRDERRGKWEAGRQASKRRRKQRHFCMALCPPLEVTTLNQHAAILSLSHCAIVAAGQPRPTESDPLTHANPTGAHLHPHPDTLRRKHHCTKQARKHHHPNSNQAYDTAKNPRSRARSLTAREPGVVVHPAPLSIRVSRARKLR